MKKNSSDNVPVYIKMSGRMGNQMFRYAFARWLMVRGKCRGKLFIDFSNIRMENSKGEMEGWVDALKDLSVMPYDSGSPADDPLWKQTTLWEKMCLAVIFIADRPFKGKETGKRLRVRRRFLPWLDRHGIYLLFTGYDYPFNPSGSRRKIVSGPFECARYCEEIRDVLLKEFRPVHPVLEKNAEFLRKIREEQSVCVTIRRGNYLAYPHLNVCTQEYFEDAAEEIKKRVKNPLFVVFSDDIAWARDHLKFPGETIYETGDDPLWEKMRLMSACRHFIISNSTFSWWAQFLGEDPEKLVIAPDHWFNDTYQPPLYQKNWITLKVRKAEVQAE